MSDIKYVDKLTRNIIGQQNGVNYAPLPGDIYSNDKGKWKIAEVHVGSDILCIVEEAK